MEDPIPSRLFSSASDIILPVLMKLVNQSLKEGSMEGINWSVLDPLMKKIGLDPEVDKNLIFLYTLPYFQSYFPIFLIF